jgi:UDP-N-acetylglucosamine 3-dehydrogenase
MHRDCVEVAVKNKKHILLEKPLAKDLVDGNAMYEVLKDYDKVFTVGFLLRFDPRFNMIKQSLDNGTLGDIIHVYCRRNSPIIGPRRYIGASDLSMHVMIHDIDYINWYMQCNPVKVFAKARSVLLKEHQMQDVIYALVTYENGAIACLEACWVLPENSPTIIDDKLELVGTKGVAYVDSCDCGVRIVSNSKIEYPDSRHWPYVNDVPAGDLFEELMAFVNIDDLFGSIEVIVFSDCFKRSSEHIAGDHIVVVRGRINYKEGEAPKIIASKITPISVVEAYYNRKGA